MQDLKLTQAQRRGNKYLSARAIALAERSTPAERVDRLKRAGILTRSGELARRYR